MEYLESEIINNLLRCSKALSPIDRAINSFKNHEANQKNLFVLYGNVTDLKAFSEFDQYLTNYDKHYISCDIKSAKRKATASMLFEIMREFGDGYGDIHSEKRQAFPEDVLFEILEELGDLLSEIIDNNYLRLEWLDTFHRLRKIRKEIIGRPSDEKLAEFVRFTRSDLNEKLDIVLKEIGSVIIGLNRFELVCAWSQKIYNYLLKYLIINPNIDIILFVNHKNQPDLFDGSDEYSQQKGITFFKHIV